MPRRFRVPREWSLADGKEAAVRITWWNIIAHDPVAAKAATEQARITLVKTDRDRIESSAALLEAAGENEKSGFWTNKSVRLVARRTLRIAAVPETAQPAGERKRVS
ncbi:hypothetical protein [Microvirga massiliensis]|uniref:hypothetical protein n=1 Tax=Microvirga massiliensis TaxID=1033741 RepID=UPI00062BAFB6|nr:hypothetical protein [Microvirga massiliensis]